MSLIERVYASGGDVIIDTLELTCPVWTEPVLICGGFEDQTCGIEDGRTLQFVAAGIDVSLPKKSNSVSQTINFAIDNVLGEAQQKMDQAKAAGAQIVIDIADQDYGGRGYACRDIEGHLWWFGSYDPWKDHG